MGDFGKGVTHFNMTEIEAAVQEVKDAIDGIPTAEKSCKKVAADLGSILASIKKIKGPKDLVIHIVDNLFDDSEKIFGELAAAVHAYKTGWDYMTAGQQMGMSVRRLVVGEGTPSPAPTPTPPAAKLQLFEGFAVGFISDKPVFMTCSQEVRTCATEFAQAVKDLESGFRHFNVTEIEDAVREFEMFTKCAAPARATCQAAIGVVENDVKAIVAALKAIKGPKDLVLKIVANFFSDSEDIFDELSAASKAFKAAEYMGSGRQLGMAFHRMLVGLPNSEPPTLIA